MEKITWDKSFSIGVRKLDEQHRRIINVINLLFLDPDKGVRSEAISEALIRLKKYAEEHFRTEEDLMEAHGYPDLAAHREEHAAYMERVADFCIDTMKDRPEVPEELVLYVRGWLVDHILKEDMKFSTFLKKEVSRGGG